MVGSRRELTLSELKDTGDIDLRSYNLCKHHDISTVQQLIEHFMEFGSFLDWPNCGQICNIILVRACKKYSKVDLNVLRLDRKALEFNSKSLAFKALESGFVDAIVFTNTPNCSDSFGRLQLQGRIAVCKSFDR